MAGQSLDAVSLGWHGFEGDRRFALRRIGVQNGFPWLTAGRFPKLLLYTPFGQISGESAALPSHVRTPDGRELEIRSDELRQEISGAYGSPLEMMRLDQGIFDEAKVSIISHSTIQAIEQESGVELEVARFRPNILVETVDGTPFQEDAWVGKTILIGRGTETPALQVYMRDLRCAMINYHPKTGIADPGVMKAVVRMNENNAGAYASVRRTGTVSPGDRLYLEEE